MALFAKLKPSYGRTAGVDGDFVGACEVERPLKFIGRIGHNFKDFLFIEIGHVSPLLYPEA